MTAAPSYGFGSFSGSGRGAAGQRRKTTPISFLNNYINTQPSTSPSTSSSNSSGFYEISPTTMMESSAQQSETQPQQSGGGMQADISAWQEASKAYANWKPKVVALGNDTYSIQDRRIPWTGSGFGTPRMHTKSGKSAQHLLRLIGMGRYNPIVPNPSLAKTFTSGALTINTIPQGPSSYTQKATVTGPMTLAQYNEAAKDIYQQMTGTPFGGYTPDTNLAAGVAPKLDATRPQSALVAGMPVDLEGYTRFLTSRLGDPELAAKRAKMQIGGKLYREGVKQGYYEPGIYARHGAKYKIV